MGAQGELLNFSTISMCIFDPPERIFRKLNEISEKKRKDQLYVEASIFEATKQTPRISGQSERSISREWITK
jgi:hypothetical protein